MKKEYVTPRFKVVEIKYQGMLAYSGGSLAAPELNPDDLDDIDWNDIDWDNLEKAF